MFGVSGRHRVAFASAYVNIAIALVSSIENRVRRDTELQSAKLRVILKDNGRKSKFLSLLLDMIITPWVQHLNRADLRRCFCLATAFSIVPTDLNPLMRQFPHASQLPLIKIRNNPNNDDIDHAPESLSNRSYD